MGMFNPSQAMSQNIAAQNAFNGTSGPALTTGAGLFGSSVDPVAMQQMMQNQQNMQMATQAQGISNPYARLGAIQAQNAKMLGNSLSHGIDAFFNGGQSSDPMVQKAQKLQAIQQQFANRDDYGTSQWYKDAAKTLGAAGFSQNAQEALKLANTQQSADDAHQKAGNENTAAADTHAVNGNIDYIAAKILGPKYENLKNQAQAGDANAQAALTELKTKLLPLLTQSEVSKNFSASTAAEASAALNRAKIPHVGEGPEGSLSLNKIQASLVAKYQGMPFDKWPAADQSTFKNASMGNPLNALLIDRIAARLGDGKFGGTNTDTVPNPITPAAIPASPRLPSLAPAGTQNNPPPKLPGKPGSKDFSNLWK